MKTLKNIFFWVAVAALLGVALWTFFSKKSESFQNPSEPTFTMYYADWCGHCKNAKPEFQKLVDKSPMMIGGKSCTIRMVSPEKEPDLAKGKPIKGFPTFLLETPDGAPIEYKGARSTQDYLDFINKNLGGATGDVSGDTDSAT